MKKLTVVFLINFICLSFQFLSADLPGYAPSSPSSVSKKPTSTPFPKPPPQQEINLPRPRIPPPPVPAREEIIPFTLPGIVGLKDGQWVGSDNLYNLRPDISIYVEIVKQEDQHFDLSEDQIRARIQDVFSRANIAPRALIMPGEPALPLFHVLLMFSSVDQCLTASCTCRLFEQVTLKRVIQEEGITFQAITWEKQNLISASKKDFYQLLDKTIDDIAQSFVDRFQYFQNLRFQKSR